MSAPIKIPADVEVEDRVLGPLTARQLAVFTATALVLYVVWRGTHGFVPLPVFGAAAVVVGGGVAVLVLGRRDGLPLDRLLLAAVRQRLQPRMRVAAPEGIQPAPAWITAHTTTDSPHDEGGVGVGIGLPAEDISEAGVLDLGRDGLAVVAACSTVNFALRTPGEQESLVGVFARWLHSLTAPAQILVRAERLDVSAQVADLDARAPGLPHPALEAAAREHAGYLADLAAGNDLLRRQVLLVLREPRTPLGGSRGLGGVLPGRRGREHSGGHVPGSAERRAAETRLARRLGEATELLHPAGITVTPLDAAQAETVLASACNPDRLLPATAELASADDIVTAHQQDEERQ
ncbi:PrgI family protein [Saccharopolyspora sp. 6M]|uniref:PrgI family protein n=1 Tax=Saccharopolyspora sp. 6M TaxID=2877237 RepID=UPI001CD2FA44|nr:PrgI family protein [Saccharopolyspora sp. 6M]MCA1229655.1 PrgI family protein [Saccharopolyspora sp. 6M]